MRRLYQPKSINLNLGMIQVSCLTLHLKWNPIHVSSSGSTEALTCFSYAIFDTFFIPPWVNQKILGEVCQLRKNIWWQKAWGIEHFYLKGGLKDFTGVLKFFLMKRGACSQGGGGGGELDASHTNYEQAITRTILSNYNSPLLAFFHSNHCSQTDSLWFIGTSSK